MNLIDKMEEPPRESFFFEAMYVCNIIYLIHVLKNDLLRVIVMPCASVWMEMGRGQCE